MTTIDNSGTASAYIFSQATIESDQAQVTLARWTGWVVSLLCLVF